MFARIKIFYLRFSFKDSCVEIPAINYHFIGLVIRSCRTKQLEVVVAFGLNNGVCWSMNRNHSYQSLSLFVLHHDRKDIVVFNEIASYFTAKCSFTKNDDLPPALPLRNLQTAGYPVCCLMGLLRVMWVSAKTHTSSPLRRFRRCIPNFFSVLVRL